MAKNFKSSQAEALALVKKTEDQVEEGLENVAKEPSIDEQQQKAAGNNGSAASASVDNAQANDTQGEIVGSIFDGGEMLASRKVMTEPTKGVQVPMPESIYMRMMMYKLRNNVSLKDMLVEATKYWLDAMEKKEKRQKRG